MHHTEFLIGAGAVLAALAVAGILFERLGQSVVPAFILLGLALRPLRLDQELGRVRHGNGAFSIVARLSAQESVRLLASPGVRLDPVSLEDLFEEVTR